MEYRSIADMKKNPKNPRIIKDDGFLKLKESLESEKGKEHFEARPCIISTRTGEHIIIAGNTRYQAAKDLGWKEIPVVIMEGLTEDQENEIIIRDNVSNGEWDWGTLTSEWDVKKLEEWGLDIPELEILDEEVEATEDDYEMPDEVKTDIVLGDLIEIGEHRLLCGDSTSIDAVEKLMNGEKADMGFNDPPYGMKKEKEGVIGDNMNYDDLLDFNKEWIATQWIILKENGSFYCWGIDEPLMDIYSEILKPYFKEQKATFRNLITWDKGNGQGQNSENTRSYAIADEKCLFVMCGVQGFNNNSDNYFEGWEPIRDYLLKSRLEMGWDVPTMKKIVGHSDLLRDHWTSKSQFNFPTREVYNKMKKEADSLREKTGNDAFKKEYDELKKEYDELKWDFYATRAYFNNTHDNFNNVWKFERHIRQGDEGGHATPKPIALCERAIKSSCPDRGLIVDFFLGSGSTMVASHQLKRKCYGMELDPKYCQVIVDRMKKLDPSLVIKRNGNIWMN